MKKKMRWTFAFLFILFHVEILHAETNKVLKIGFGYNKPPYVLENENSGLEVEIFREAAASVGYGIDPVFAPLARLKVMLESGFLDAVTVTNSQERLKFHYSEPYLSYNNYAIALKKKNLKIKNVADLKSYSVTSFQRASHLLGPDFAKMASQNEQYREFADQKLRNIQLFHERFDVAIADKRIFHYFSNQLQKEGEAVPSVIWYDLFPANQYSAAFRSEKLVKEFNNGLKIIKKNGTYKKIEIKYRTFD